MQYLIRHMGITSERIIIGNVGVHMYHSCTIMEARSREPNPQLISNI